MTPAPDDTLPRMVPRDEESVRIENETRAEQERIESVLRDRMKTLSREMHETRATGVGAMSLPSDPGLKAIIDTMFRPESDCHGFEPPHEGGGGILPIDPEGDAETERLRQEVAALRERLDRFEKRFERHWHNHEGRLLDS